MEKTTSSQPKSARIDSIDILRGIIILIMIFVNDLAGVPNTPQWMRHMPTYSDGMTFVDLVFPAFLFIVGISMPFSIGRRLETNNDLWATWKHIIIRVLGLLVLGFYTVNGDAIGDPLIINPHLWIILMYLCVIIIWNRIGSAKGFLNQKSLKFFAGAVLVILFLLFRGENQTGLIQMVPRWWGILGLIGWAYLGACIIYIPLRKSPLGLTAGVALLYCFFLAVKSGMLSGFPFLNSLVKITDIFGSHTAIVLSGVILGNRLNESRDKILKWSAVYSFTLFFAGILLHQLHEINNLFIISKNLATVPWCLLCSALTIWIWMAIYWLVDLKKIKGWIKIIEPAGTNPLFAYILAPLVVECFILISYAFNGFDIYDRLGSPFYVGLIRALAVAFIMTWLSGLLSKKGIQLKL